jgi:hypothetical protein
MDRRIMAEVLEEHLRNVNVYFDREGEFPKGRGPLKTYLMEVHAPDGEDLDHRRTVEVLSAAAKGADLQFERTDDEALFQLTRGDIGFFFDVLDPRFWVVHTMSNIKQCEPVLDFLVDLYPNFDYAWPPSELMRDIQKIGKPAGFAVDFDETALLPASESHLIDEPNAVVKFRFGGTRAETWLTELERFAPDALAFSMVKFSRQDQGDDSYIITELNEHGRLKAAGNSINLHLGTVALFLHQYRSFIGAIESFGRLRSQGEGKGGLLLGDPLVLEFPDRLRDFRSFVKELVSCREPLKIWGVVQEVRRDFVQIEAVDLHTASRLRLDVTPEFMRIYLGPTACGNTVARILRNIQGHVNSMIRLDLRLEETVA